MALHIGESGDGLLREWEGVALGATLVPLAIECILSSIVGGTSGVALDAKKREDCCACRVWSFPCQYLRVFLLLISWNQYTNCSVRAHDGELMRSCLQLA